MLLMLPSSSPPSLLLCVWAKVFNMSSRSLYSSHNFSAFWKRDAVSRQKQFIRFVLFAAFSANNALHVFFWPPIRILYHQNWLYFNFDRKAAPTMRSNSINSKKHMKSTQAHTHTLNDDDDDELTHNALVRSLDCATQFVHLRCWFVCWLRSSVSVSRSVALPYKNNSFFRSECDNSPTLTESEQQPSTHNKQAKGNERRDSKKTCFHALWPIHKRVY